MSEKVQKTEAEWRAQLDPATYSVTRQKATERPFTGKYYTNKEKGTYHCICCDAPLFDTASQFDAGCGWPSFTDPVVAGNVRYEQDLSHGMRRIEVLCNVCDAHLGHVFDDGPGPGGKRFCINSVSLDLKAKGE